MQSYEKEVTKDAISDIARRQAAAKAKGQKYIDPNAELSGFKRDTWKSGEGLPLEARQQEFLESQTDDSSQEMPKDLIDFLNDAGPLERVVDKDFTSEKVYDSLLEEEEQRQQEQQSRQRTRRRMPIIEQMEGGHGDKDAMDGTTVERTTNFSQAVKEEKEDDIRMSDQELFDLAWKLQNNETTPDKYFLDRFGGKQTEVLFTEGEKKHNIDLLQSMKRHISIPLLMQDTDLSLVGTTTENIETLKLMKLRMAPKTVQLSLNVDSASDEQMNKQKLKKAVVLK